MDESEDILLRTIRWFTECETASHGCGGSVGRIIEQIPPKVLLSLIRNGLIIAYSPWLNAKIPGGLKDGGTCS